MISYPYLKGKESLYSYSTEADQIKSCSYIPKITYKRYWGKENFRVNFSKKDPGEMPDMLFMRRTDEKSWLVLIKNPDENSERHYIPKDEALSSYDRDKCKCINKILEEITENS